jgi:uncharacterized protein YlaI
MIKRTELITFIDRLYCDDCIEVEMKFTGIKFLTNPIRTYEYICPDCHKIRHDSVKYPNPVEKKGIEV